MMCVRIPLPLSHETSRRRPQKGTNFGPDLEAGGFHSNISTPNGSCSCDVALSECWEEKKIACDRSAGEDVTITDEKKAAP